MHPILGFVTLTAAKIPSLGKASNLNVQLIGRLAVDTGTREESTASICFFSR
jgi:hypothetical protein